MTDSVEKIYQWDGINWFIDRESIINGITGNALCPKKGCHCELTSSSEPYTRGQYKYICPKCSFKITLNKPLDQKVRDFLKVYSSERYKDAEVLKLDDVLVIVQKEEVKDDEYWVRATITKNKKSEKQLMVLAGSRKDRDKVQLFLEPATERFAFDQNNDHPTKIFSKVIAIFKNSSSSISGDIAQKVGKKKQ